MQTALINYVNYCAKDEFCGFQDHQALCVCVAAATGAFVTSKKTQLDFWSMYFVNLLLFL